MKELFVTFLMAMGLGGSYFLGFMVLLLIPVLAFYIIYYLLTLSNQTKLNYKATSEKIITLGDYDFSNPGEVKYQLGQDIEILEDLPRENYEVRVASNEK